jgi:UDP-N-acetyl-D-glucosamine dehydrogenase
MSTSLDKELLTKIENRTAVCGVIGLGYVGLPLVVELAHAGFRVIGIDVSPQRVDQVNKGESYVGDVASETLLPLVREGRVRADLPGDAIREMDTVSICVPTPLRKTKDPDISYIVASTRELEPRLRRGSLVVLESTTYPGTTEEVILPKLAESLGEVGQDFFLAFSPERVDPGNPTWNTKNTPKVVGGMTPACSELARALYSAAVETVIPVDSPATAEMVKLLENTFRSVNIGLVNEVAIMCHKLGVSVWQVIDAAKTKPFGFMPFYPGPGLGGHCIPIDPHYLSWKLKTLNYNARFIELAGEINSAMPEYVVTLSADALNSARKPINGSKVLVLGVAYKKNVADPRESPALDIIELLRRRGAEVSFSDPHIESVRTEAGEMHSVPFDSERLAGSDLVIVATDHDLFDRDLVLEASPLIVDTRNFLKGAGSADKVFRL